MSLFTREYHKNGKDWYFYMLDQALEIRRDSGPQNLPNPARWETSHSRPLGMLDVTTAYMKPILQDMGVTEDHIDNTFTRISNFFKPNRETYYISEYSAAASVIVVASMNWHLHHAPNKPIPEDFSHITFPMWKLVCRENEACINRLNKVVTKNIVNAQTVALIRELFPSPMGDSIYCWELTPEDDEFYVLFASHIGVNMGALSFDYIWSVNHATVSKIRVYYVTRLDAYFLAEFLGYDDQISECSSGVSESGNMELEHTDEMQVD